jgi:hypothetical protein
MKRKQIWIGAIFLTLSALYTCLEAFGTAPLLRQALMLPLCNVLELLGLDPFSGEVPVFLRSIDVDVDGFGQSVFRLAVFMLLTALVLGLWLVWQRAPHRWSILTSKRHRSAGLVLASLLSVAFIAFAWVVIDRSLFTAWEPGIPSEERYFSAEHIRYSLFCLFGVLWWITLPFLLLISYMWFATIRCSRSLNRPDPKRVEKLFTRLQR